MIPARGEDGHAAFASTRAAARLAEAWACARIMEDKRGRDEALNDKVPDAFLAAAATRGLAVVTWNTGEFRKTGRDRRALDHGSAVSLAADPGRRRALGMVRSGRSIAVASACSVPPVRDSTVEARTIASRMP